MCFPLLLCSWLSLLVSRQGHGHLIVRACGSLGADGEVWGVLCCNLPGTTAEESVCYLVTACVCVCIRVEAELTSSQRGTGLQPYASASPPPSRRANEVHVAPVSSETADHLFKGEAFLRPTVGVKRDYGCSGLHKEWMDGVLKITVGHMHHCLYNAPG